MNYLTIAFFRWFSKQPSPLNGNHRVRWFSDGFWVPPNGCPPSVKRCDAMAHRSSLGGFVGWPLSHEVIHLDKAGQWSFRKDCDIRRWLVRWLATNGACDAFGISEDTALLEIREAIKKWGNSKRAKFGTNTIRWQQLFKSLISIFDVAAGFFLFFICMEYPTFHISGCHEECSWEMKNKYILSKSKKLQIIYQGQRHFSHPTIFSLESLCVHLLAMALIRWTLGCTEAIYVIAPIRGQIWL